MLWFLFLQIYINQVHFPSFVYCMCESVSMCVSAECVLCIVISRRAGWCK